MNLHFSIILQLDHVQGLLNVAVGVVVVHIDLVAVGYDVVHVDPVVDDYDVVHVDLVVVDYGVDRIQSSFCQKISNRICEIEKREREKKTKKQMMMKL
jgi:hypothetical protein